MNGKNLCGILPPITTPFGRDGELLVERFRENLERWAGFGLSGLTVLGSNGESPYLSDEEKLVLVRESRARVDSTRTLIAGAGRESTRLCLAFIRKIADLGADYALVGTPCYFKARMTDDALFAHYWTIADESPVPILVYNVPQFTGVGTSASLVRRLAAHENIAGLKESSANLALQGEICRSVRKDFRLLVGSAPTLLASLIQGACGGIVAIGCALPELTIQVYEAFRAGRWQEASALQERLSPPAAAVTTGFGVPGLKAAMDLTGFFGGEPRLPLLPLTASQRAELTAVFQAAGVLGAATQQSRN
jgi:4-hydroxy-2-oxoglutarate aldolase